ncbi:wingless-related MMTV integration site 4, isoform CRA_b [Rattus norvegicus]|uniref:Wingless-related MMTV integration site 4, isoform CRA_b n=1 Tax=Rattus norvegicus TaxID=10116 RepID=A6ITD1_RAT|nr:wingless-related MMTV integration site 4, isoform CRA_b [Rattus norvegicus]
MSPRSCLRSLRLLVFAVFSAAASNWLYCAVAAASTQRTWSWQSAAAAGSTGAASSSAGSASGSWRCTRAGDRARLCPGPPAWPREGQ